MATPPFSVFSARSLGPFLTSPGSDFDPKDSNRDSFKSALKSRCSNGYQRDRGANADTRHAEGSRPPSPHARRAHAAANDRGEGGAAQRLIRIDHGARSRRRGESSTPAAATALWRGSIRVHDKTCSVFGSWCCFDRRRVMNSADVADAMERTRESIDESRQLMADVPESMFAGSPRRWNRAGSGIVGLLPFAGRIRRRIC